MFHAERTREARDGVREEGVGVGWGAKKLMERRAISRVGLERGKGKEAGFGDETGDGLLELLERAVSSESKERGVC